MGSIEQDPTGEMRMKEPEMKTIENDVSKNKRQKPLIVVIGIALLFLAEISMLFSGFIILRENYIYERSRANSRIWPVTAGEAIKTDIDVTSDQEGNVDYRPIINYRYHVAGVDYFCNFSLKTTSSYKKAVDALGSFLNETELQVRYNPTSPQICATEYDKGSGVIIYIFGLLLLAAGIYLVVRTISFVRKL